MSDIEELLTGLTILKKYGAEDVTCTGWEAITISTLAENKPSEKDEEILLKCGFKSSNYGAYIEWVWR